MSHKPNTDALANQAQGGGSHEFKPRVEPDGPMTTKGHQPGKLVGKDAVPEFEAETLPAGSAPASRTFQPNPVNEVPAVSGRNDPDMEPAQDVMPGADSSEVHTGLGHPGSGMSSAEIRHDGEKGRKNRGQGLQGVGASTQEFKTVDASDPKFKHHRAIDNEDRVLGRGEILSAEEREAESAESVAVEHGQKERRDRGS